MLTSRREVEIGKIVSGLGSGRVSNVTLDIHRLLFFGSFFSEFEGSQIIDASRRGLLQAFSYSQSDCEDLPK